MAKSCKLYNFTTDEIFTELGEREKRIPYYYPIRPHFYNQARGEDLDEDDNELGKSPPVKIKAISD